MCIARSGAGGEDPVRHLVQRARQDDLFLHAHIGAPPDRHPLRRDRPEGTFPVKHDRQRVDPGRPAAFAQLSAGGDKEGGPDLVDRNGVGGGQGLQ